ncbi:MAG: CBU_0592 family membrane protein [Thermoanaerobaculia bacterium]
MIQWTTEPSTQDLEAGLYFQVLSIVGAVLILFAYLAHQLRKMSAETIKYQALNFVGGFFLTVTAYVDRQYGFILMEGAWTLISLWGLWNVTRGRHVIPLP